jgi:chaperonin GroES
MLNDRVLVRRFDEATKTKGGIIIPDTYRERPMSGVVVEIGTGRWHPLTGKKIPIDVKKGDEVVFAKYAGMAVKIEEGDYLVIKEDDIVMVL